MLTTVVLAFMCSTLVLGHHDINHTGNELAAIVSLSGAPNVRGNITFTQLMDGKVHIQGTIVGVPQGTHAVHVHEKGDITGGCLSTKGHFNPEKKNHGHPNDEDRHVGDLGNIEFDSTGTAIIDMVDSQISLVGPHSIIGRAFVMHEGIDDFGRTDHRDSKITGNAGGRLACGVIGILNPSYGWSKRNAGSDVATTKGLILPTVTMMFLLR